MMIQPTLFEKGDSFTSAVISQCKRYRYVLRRRLDYGYHSARESSVLWVMLNPSTADAVIDDPTIGKCLAFSRGWGFKQMSVVNLFALRSTDPKALSQCSLEESIGPDNDAYIREEAAYAQEVICAWGIHGALGGRPERVMSTLRLADAELKALRVCKNGEPGHPLYLAANTERFPYAR